MQIRIQQQLREKTIQSIITPNNASKPSFAIA
jgi:hypothetical protein